MRNGRYSNTATSTTVDDLITVARDQCHGPNINTHKSARIYRGRTIHNNLAGIIVGAAVDYCQEGRTSLKIKGTVDI